MKKVNTTIMLFILAGCATTEVKKEMTVPEKIKFISEVAINPQSRESTKYDETGCVIKPGNYSFDDIIFDVNKKMFYLPGGEIISKMEALSLIPGLSMCNK
jgi:hypothetical protein